MVVIPAALLVTLLIALALGAIDWQHLIFLAAVALVAVPVGGPPGQ